MATTTGWRKVVVLGASVAAIALLAGCGGGGGGGGGDLTTPVGADAPRSERTEQSPLDIVRAAPEAMKAAGTSRFEQETTTTANNRGVEIRGDSTVTGSYDYVGHIGDGHRVTHSSGGPSHVTGSMSHDLVFTSDSEYNRTPGETRWRKVGTQWSSGDPSRMLEVLHAVADAREGDTVRVRDVEVRQYAITIDPALLDGAAAEAGNQATLDPRKSAGPLSWHVYIDSDGRVRRIELPFEIADPQAAIGLKSDLRVDYFDFGVPVTTQVPDPSLVDAY
jgi:hypothetical protein